MSATAVEKLSFETDPVPLEKNEDGVIRVGGTRVTLDTVIYAFKQGFTAEEIVYHYPSLRLSDVYAVISYYLQRKEEVDVYLSEREKLSEEIRKENEKRFNQKGIRERLLARRREDRP